MNKKIRSFTDLKTWQEGHRLVILIYQMTEKFPKEEVYSLTSQIRRSAISVTSNIAEGFGRKSYKEKIQFYYLSQGSILELKNQLLVARDVGYLNNKNFINIATQANKAHQLLQGLISKTKTFILSS